MQIKLLQSELETIISAHISKLMMIPPGHEVIVKFGGYSYDHTATIDIDAPDAPEPKTATVTRLETA